MSVANPYESDRFAVRHKRLVDIYEQLYDQYLAERPEQRIYLKPQLESALKDVQDCRLQQVRRYQLNHAYDEASQLLKLMLADEPENIEAIKQQAELDSQWTLRAQAERLIRKVARIREPHFKAIVQDVVGALRRVEASETYQELLDEVANLQNEPQSITDFIDWWGLVMESATAQPAARRFDRHGLGRSIVQGNKVLFLGGNVVNAGQEHWSESQLVRQLVQEANIDFQGTLSAIAEYFVEQGDLGRAHLLEQMTQNLPPQSLSVPLYTELAQLPARLVLISASYDGLLEQALQDGNKRFITLTSLLPSNQHSLGKVRVQYFDPGLPKKEALLRTKEDISKLADLEQYSIVYKLRGQCDPGWPEDALALTESDYFRFAHYAEEMIPDYMIRLLNQFGCLFVGYNPVQWEERLLVDALLRRSEYRALQAVNSQPPQPLESVFWRKQRVEQCPLSVAELAQLLQAGQTA